MLITHHRHIWKTLLRHGDTARPERHRIIRWHKDIRQANHIVRVMSDGASHQFLILVGYDEDNLWIGQQCWKKDTRLLGGWIIPLGCRSAAISHFASSGALWTQVQWRPEAARLGRGWNGARHSHVASNRAGSRA